MVNKQTDALRQPTLARKVRWLRAIDRAAVIFRATRNEPLNEAELARVLRLSLREIIGFLDYVIAERLLEGVIMAGDEDGLYRLPTSDDHPMWGAREREHMFVRDCGMTAGRRSCMMAREIRPSKEKAEANAPAS